MLCRYVMDFHFVVMENQCWKRGGTLSTKSHCFMTVAHVCTQLATESMAARSWSCDLQAQNSKHRRCDCLTPCLVSRSVCRCRFRVLWIWSRASVKCRAEWRRATSRNCRQSPSSRRSLVVAATVTGPSRSATSASTNTRTATVCAFCSACTTSTRSASTAGLKYV